MEPSLSAICGEVLEASRFLLDPSPENLDRSAQILQIAAGKLKALQFDFQERESAAEKRAEALRLKTALGYTQRLLDNAALFHRNWLARKCVLSVGYTREGTPAELDGGPRVLVEG